MIILGSIWFAIFTASAPVITSPPPTGIVRISISPISSICSGVNSLAAKAPKWQIFTSSDSITYTSPPLMLIPLKNMFLISYSPWASINTLCFGIDFVFLPSERIKTSASSKEAFNPVSSFGGSITILTSSLPSPSALIKKHACPYQRISICVLN